jgi:tRNA G18 (ribose-2'-O)-methylase SpoU
LHGFAAITRLAKALGVKAAFHGHHHEDISYPNSVWRAVGLRQIVAYHWDG